MLLLVWMSGVTFAGVYVMSEKCHKKIVHSVHWIPRFCPSIALHMVQQTARRSKTSMSYPGIHCEQFCQMHIENYPACQLVVQPLNNGDKCHNEMSQCPISCHSMEPSRLSKSFWKSMKVIQSGESSPVIFFSSDCSL